MKKQVRNEVEELFKNLALETNAPKLTEADMTHLPEPVRRYLTYTNVVGKLIPRCVRLKQKGLFRMNSDQKWMPLEAEEYYSVDPPGFIWYGSIKPFPLTTVNARDMFMNGQGSMIVKLMGRATIGDDTGGKEISQGGLLRYLSEMIWFPGAFLSEYVEWQPIDDYSAEAKIRVGELTASAVFHVDQDGQIVDVHAKRYRSANEEYYLDKWSTPITKYGEFNEIMVPVVGEAVWHLDDEDFCYIRITEINDLEYDVPEMY